MKTWDGDKDAADRPTGRALDHRRLECGQRLAPRFRPSRCQNAGATHGHSPCEPVRVSTRSVGDATVEIGADCRSRRITPMFLDGGTDKIASVRGGDIDGDLLLPSIGAARLVWDCRGAEEAILSGRTSRQSGTWEKEPNRAMFMSPLPRHMGGHIMYGGADSGVRACGGGRGMGGVRERVR